MNNHLKKGNEDLPDHYFTPGQDDWYYQNAYSRVVDVPKELPDDIFEDLLTASCHAYAEELLGGEFYPYAASKPDATEEERLEHLTEPKLHPNQMEFLLEEVHSQFDHQANSPEERNIAREMCQDLLDRHASNIFKPVYIDPPEGWKYGFPKALPTGEPDVLAWLIAEGYPQSVMDRYGDAFTYRILDSEE